MEIGIIIISFLAGCFISAAGLYFYIKQKRKRKRIPSDFELSDYSSQQLAKLLGQRILSNCQEKLQLRSVDPVKLPLEFKSQWCEDIALFDFFQHKKDGFYIEIGAFDGVRLSNTYFFECVGWKGVLVEPQPVQYNKCKTNRPNSLCYNVAIGSGNQDLELNIVQDEHYETWSFVGDKDKAEKETGFKIETIKVKSKTINELIPAEIRHIDFISIDVEGMEQEILRTIDLEKYSPEIILLENSTKEIQNYLGNYGYKLVYRTWINYFYCKSDKGFKNISLWNDVDLPILG